MPDTNELSPEAAAGKSRELQTTEQTALRIARETAELSVLDPRKVGDDAVMNALDTLRGAQEEGRQFAEENIEPLAEAAVQDYLKAREN